MVFLTTTLAANPLKEFVNLTKLHPILVDFTAALIPVSVAGDFLARVFKNKEFSITAWWTILLGAWITPFTAITGWLFWASDDNGHVGMTVHKWLGTSLAVLIIALFFWRRSFRQKREPVSTLYLAVAIAFVIALVIQGTLGGNQVFSG